MDSEEINKLKYGDVVWCEVSKTEKYNFEGSHKLRPFTVLYKDENYLYALAHTHDRNIGKLGHYINEKFRNVLIDEIIKIEFSSFKNRFNGCYTSKELSDLSRCLAKKYKGEEISKLISKHINFQVGDLVLVNNEKYLIRKVNENNKVSLLKLVSKDNKEITFEYNKKRFYVLKDAFVEDASNLVLLEEYGKDIIKYFEEQKRVKQERAKSNKKKEYKVGDILCINDVEHLIIDIYKDDLVVIDESNKCFLLNKNCKYQVVDTVTKQEVNIAKRKIDYDEIKLKNLLLSKNKR